MVRPRPIIITSGILVLIGIAITAYQSQTTSENLSNEQKILGIGTQMTITKNMDRNNNQKGVYPLDYCKMYLFDKGLFGLPDIFFAY